jgi:hypothetical protein
MAYIQSHKEQAWLLLPSIDVAEIEKAVRTKLLMPSSVSLIQKVFVRLFIN